ncbi:MAG: polysaccharide pyruvyl transferase family protein [Burkholderiaceae bacterium]|nr:polysaccharide pyruvyl transferase family protein [Burkholderiaceae bacterium]
MAHIAVICAHNRRNSGMYSVDRAARQFFDQLGLAHDLFVTQQSSRVGALRYRLVRDLDELCGYDTVVYWGDFLNNPMWGQADYAVRDVARHGVENLNQAFDHWRRLYLPDDSALPASTRVLALGGCFIGMEHALSDPSVKASLQRFTKRSTAVVVRDPASFELLSAATGADPRVSLGFDCASLMRTRAPAQWRAPYFAYSFGRALTPADASDLVQRVERATRLRGVPIQWLGRTWPKGFTHTRFSANLALMRHARFCLTDTYHFAMNSLSQGTFPVCIVRDEPATASTLNELKKIQLFRMVGLDHALMHIPGETMHPVPPPTMSDQAQNVADAATRATASSDWRAAYTDRQREFRAQIRQHFI